MVDRKGVVPEGEKQCVECWAVGVAAELAGRWKPTEPDEQKTVPKRRAGPG